MSSPHKDVPLSSDGKEKRCRPLQTETSYCSPFYLFPFFFLGKKKKRKEEKKKKLQLGLRGGSDFPFVRVAQQHTAYVLFGLAGGSRATAAPPSEPTTLRRNGAGVRKPARHRGKE